MDAPHLPAVPATRGPGDPAETIHIGTRPVGIGHPCLIVAEVAQAHDGSLGTAHAYVDAVARAGADAVKFQAHIAAAESTPDEPWRVAFSRQDASRYDYWRRMEFTAEQWRGLSDHAAERGLIFLASPFSEEAVDLLAAIGMPAWKIGAGEVANGPLLDRAARTGKPILLSSGMSPWDELDRAIARLRSLGSAYAVLQCASRYPCPPEKLGLNLLAEIRQRYRCPVGISDHSGVIHAGLGAAALGANLIEVHVTFSREAFGPDVPASVTLDELRLLVEGVRFLGTALSHPVDKDVEATELESMRRLFHRSLVAARDLPAGHVLARSDLRLKKPGSGIPPDRLDAVLGRRLVRRVAADALLADADLA